MRCAGCLGDLPPPSPPAEKPTAGQNQARKSGASDGAGDFNVRLNKKRILGACSREGFANELQSAVLEIRVGRQTLSWDRGQVNCLGLDKGQVWVGTKFHMIRPASRRSGRNQ